MKKFVLFILLAAAGTMCWFAAVQAQQVDMADKMIRLHVVANSDNEYDQKIKIRVRDAVLNVTELMESQDELKESLPEIQKAAETVSDGQTVCVTLAMEEFPRRVYDTFSLPAGIYQTIRVTLGNGEGKNWWCVAFPGLCMRASSELESVAVSAGFSEQDLKIMTEERYVLRFKTLEIIQKIRALLRW